MVAEKPVRDECCDVLHFHGERSKWKASILETEESIFDNGCIYHIHWPERIDSHDSVQFLKDAIKLFQSDSEDGAEQSDSVQSHLE